MIKKILLSLLGLLLVGAIFTYFYFTAGTETYPEPLAKGMAPDFRAVDQHGQDLQLSELLKKGPVVLIFYRGLWCPACQKHLGEIQGALSSFMEKGATVVAVTPELPEKTRENVRVTSSSVSIVHDKNNQIMDLYQVGYQLGTGSQRLFSVMGIDLEAANGNSQNTLPIPALFVINQAGELSYTYEKSGGLVPEYLPVSDILEHLSD